MQEQLRKATGFTTDPSARTVTIAVRASEVVLCGSWEWDLHSNAVFCSDVMSFPPDFDGTKGIIHPDDLHHVIHALELVKDTQVAQLDFRLITTFGEVRAITGKQVALQANAAPQEASHVQNEAWEAAIRDFAIRKEAMLLRLQRQLSEVCDRIHGTATWFWNKNTGEAWFSDQMYRIHGVPPQSLNAHANTFNPFIHPEDCSTVLDAFERAFAEEAPLHIEYRLVQPGGAVRTVRQVTHWLFNEKGHAVFAGALGDVTELQGLQRSLEAAQGQTQVLQLVGQFAEKQAASGYWFMNMVTRKVQFSENYLRIHGVRAPFVPSHKTFLELVHPEDQELVAGLIERMFTEHLLPDTEYRIIRPDGRQRHLRIGGKLVAQQGSELMMMGMVHDVTSQRQQEHTIHVLTEKQALYNLITEMAEQGAGLGNVLWLPDGRMLWSEGFYRMLGYKPNAVEPVLRLWQKTLHPDDLEAFKDAITLVLNQQEVGDLVFRMVGKEGVRHMRIQFRRLSTGHAEAVVGLIHDITQQVVLQQQAKGRERYTQLIENISQELILLTNTENAILSWNATAEERTGIPRGDALSANLFDIFPHLYEEQYLSQLQVALGGREVMVPRIRNSYIPQTHSFRLVPFRDEQQKVQGILHVVQDISRELEMQQQLGERLAFIESLLSATVDRIVVLDQHMNYLYWNPKAEAFYGVGKQKVLGRNILEIFPSFRNDPGYQEFRRALKGETVHIPATFSDQHQQYFETYLIPIRDEEGNVNAVLWIVHDLSREWQLQHERERTMVQLLEEHRRMQDAQAIGHIGSFEWNLGDEEATWSDELFCIMGWPPQSRPITVALTDSLVHPDDLEVVLEVKERSFRTPGSYELEHRIVRPSDGKEIYVMHRFDSLTDDQGTIVRVHGTVQDITERVEARQKLEASEQLLRDAETVAQTGSYEVGLSTMTFRFSAGMYHLFGEAPYSFEPSLAFINERSHPSDAGMVEAILQEAAINKQPYHYTRRIYHPDGSLRTLEAHGKVICDHAGNAVKFIGLVQDVTDRKKAETELLHLKDELAQQVTDKYLVLFNSIDEAVVWCELITDEHGNATDYRLLELNPAFEKMTGFSVAATKGKTARELVPNIEAWWIDTYAQVALTRKALRFEQKVAEMGRWFNTYASPVGEPGQRQFVLVFTDITERKQQEAHRAFLLQLSDALRPLANPVQIQRAAMHMLGENIGVDRVLYAEVGADGETISIADNYVQGAMPKVIGQFTAAAFGTAAQILLAGNMFSSSDIAADERLPEAERQAMHALGSRSCLVMPLIRNGRWVACLGIYHGQPRNWQPDEIRMLEDAADRTWVAVERSKIETALRQSEERFRSLVTASSDTVYQMSADWTQMMQLEGKNFLTELSEANSSWLDQYIPAAERAWVQAAITQAIESKTPFELEHQVYDVQGNIAWTYSRAIPKFDEAGNIVEWIGAASNITQRKKAEDALRESEERFRSLVEQYAQAVWETDVHGMVVADSPSWRAHTGQTLAQWLGSGWLQAVHPDHRDLAKQRWREAVATKRTINSEYRLWHAASGAYRWTNILATPLFDAAGEIVKWTGMNIDINDRKLAEERIQAFNVLLEQQVAERTADLEKSIAILQQSEALAQIGSWEYEIASGRFDWSKRMYDLLGVKQGTPVAPEIYLQCVTEASAPVAQKIVNHLKESFQPFEETLHLMVHGDERIIQVKGTVIPDASGNPLKMVGADLDITEIIEAQVKLQESQDLLAQTVAASPDAFIIFDVASREIQYLNDVLFQLTGLQREKLSNLGFDERLDLIHPSDRTRLLRFNERLKELADESVQVLDYRLIVGEKTFWLRNRSRVFRRNEAGRATQLLTILQDVTQAYAAQDALNQLNASLQQKNRELEAKNEEITSFAFVSSHDLREPIRKLHTFTDMLLHKEADRLSESGRNVLFRMATSLKRLEFLIEDILSLSRIHAEHVSFEQVDLNETLHKVTADLQDVIGDTTAEIVVEQLPIISGSASQVFYLFKNLIGNAIKFQKSGNRPHVRISAERVSGVAAHHPGASGNYVRVKVADNGIGFDKKYKEKIFRIFQRLHTAEVYSGTGMGLAICRKVMDNHDGFIDVESTPGEGATFYCYFPM